MANLSVALATLTGKIGPAFDKPLAAFYKTMKWIADNPGPLSGIRRNGAKAKLTEDMLLSLETLMADAAFIGTGGRQLNDKQRAALRTAFDEQARYMRGFCAVADKMNEATAKVRARMYIPAILRVATLMGAAEPGLPELPQTPGDGKTACKHWCKCSLDVKKLDGVGNFNVFWRLGQAEHCEDCMRLAAQWNPLRIRNGVIEGGKALSRDAVRKLATYGLIAFARYYGVEVKP
jgi:hypothetical protein